MRFIPAHLVAAFTTAAAVLPLTGAQATREQADAGLPSVPPGFVVTVYASSGGAATSLAFGPDTREGAAGNARRLYVADYAGNRVVVIDDVAGSGTGPIEFADALRSPLGVVADRNSVYVAVSEATRDGPFGLRPYGSVVRLRDTDGDGIADKRNTVIEDLPNGRHNTNGMAFGPDGMLYVTNGNSTDDGTEGGEPEVVPWSGSVIRVEPRARDVSLADLPKRQTLVAYGWRNVYDVEFSPFDDSQIFIPMNGVDDAREGSSGDAGSSDLENSDDLLFMTDIDDRSREYFGFPSCLYNVEKRGNLKPYDNPNPQTIENFGPCPKSRIGRPVSSFGTHVSADGLAFQTTRAWGGDFYRDLFVAQFGNFFGDEVVGHDVVQVEFDGSGTRVTGQTQFMNGGAPLDVTFDRSGAMYVADFGGPIYKVTKL